VVSDENAAPVGPPISAPVHEPVVPVVRAPRRWLPFAVVGGVVLAFVILVAAWPDDEARRPANVAPTTFDLRGEMTLTDSNLLRISSTSCAGQAGYSDIGPNAQVTVSADGRVVAVGFLGAGSFRGSVTCAFPIVVDGVPLGHDFYSVEVTHRGQVNYPASAVQAGPISVTLG
jgi:hypothetical protein